MSKIHVFVGPTLPAAEVPADFVVHPPVAVGDVLRMVRARTRPGAIAIVDGYFERMAAVWHKELLHALERGIPVYGAASMGALRAAELDRFGMIGVGTIYRDYRAGRLVADDEVAVVHLPAAQGYAGVSDALVDLRYGLGLAVRAHVLGRRAADELVVAMAGRFYRERSWAAVLALARSPKLAAWHARGVPSRKTLDARLLMRRLRGREARPAQIVVPRTWAIRRFASEL
ncbi:MAG: TfuA-like protein [Proteobacteria bacterium]|nr:TfuA-like protein [Pseudomonadota bacterium]